jgi:DNA repair ATPase RecN
MKNKELFQQKLGRIDGKVKTLRVMTTRQGTSVQDIHDVLESITDELSDLNSMVERMGTVYGR